MEETLDIELLFAQIGRYLVAVDLYRGEGCEPRWAAEGREAAAGPTPELLHVRDVTGRRKGGVNDETV